MSISKLLTALSIFLTLVVLAIYTYVYFFQIPYAGFDFSNGRVVVVNSLGEPGSELKIGDLLLQIGSVSWSDFAADGRKTFFDGVKVGETVPLIIQRDAQIITIPWRFPGFNNDLFIARLYSTWWLPYVFWLIAVVTYLSVRPKDTTWFLLLAFNLLTAVWLSVGSGPSHWHEWGSALILRASLWLCLPVYWHFHWVFPRPLARLPSILVWAVYLTAITMAVLELLQILPPNIHLLAFLAAVTGSLLLLFAHAIFKPDQRRNLLLVWRIVVLIILPVIAVAVAGVVGSDLRIASLVFVGLPLIPIAYVYAIYRYRLGARQLRANRLLTTCLYLLLLSLVTGVFLVLLSTVIPLTGEAFFVGLGTAVAAGLLTNFAFRPVERFIERRILGIPLPPASLLETYTTQIVTKLDKASLANLLKHEVLPSLLVRQSAIVYYDQKQELSTLFTLDVDEDELPQAATIPQLLRWAQSYRPLQTDEPVGRSLSWLHLILPLFLENRLLGLWLLGRRDPDDMYNPSEIPTLQALAAQTAIALANILQSENLHELYQADIDRQERERNLLALELHDEILNQIALMGMYVDEQCVAPEFYPIYEGLAGQIRRTIQALRPAMLNYGLQAALSELADNLSQRVEGRQDIQFELPPSDCRYSLNVERHLFRIIQQAAENAIQHASAKTIRIGGQLDSNCVHLYVEDDGVGISGKHLDLSALLADKHFGLAGMHERAILIGADFEISSAPAQGARVKVSWCAT